MLALLPYPNIDPVLFSFDIMGLTLAIRWYALAYIAGFLLAWWWANRTLYRVTLWPNDTAPMTKKHTEDILTWAIIGVILGGRLGYVLFYTEGAWMQDPSMIYKVWEGGMSFHGGLAGVMVATVLFSWRYELNTWSVSDVMALGAPIGLFLGRLANFVNAELWGRPTDAPWGVVFPGAPECPLTWLSPVCARHPSQLYEAVLEGIILFCLIGFLAYKRGILKRPGTAAAVFFIGYGLARFCVEFVRQGDEQFTSLNNPWGHYLRLGQDPSSLGFTMGQLLSLPMLGLGLILFFYVRKK